MLFSQIINENIYNSLKKALINKQQRKQIQNKGDANWEAKNRE